MISRTATEEMTKAANPPQGYEPIVSHSAFGWENGPVYEKTSDTECIRGFRVAERHTNAGGVCHGGMMMTFADILLGSAALRASGRPCVTVRMTTDFLGPAQIGDWIEGIAEAHSAGGGLFSIVATMRVGDRAVAHASALFKAFGPKA